jgi:hypothetical protein
VIGDGMIKRGRSFDKSMEKIELTLKMTPLMGQNSISQA